MSRVLGRIAGGIHVVALVCFALPFASLSCGGSKIATASGFDLLRGPKITRAEAVPKRVQRRGPEPLAIAAAACAAVGALAFAGRRWTAALGFFTGIAGALALVFLKLRLDGQVTDQSRGLVKIVYEPGYWAAFVLLALAALVAVTGALVPRHLVRGRGGGRPAPPAAAE